MYKNNKNQILFKLFFNEFKFFSFIISLITIFLLLTFFVKREIKLTYNLQFVNSQIKLDNKFEYLGRKSINTEKFIILNVENLISNSKSENIAKFLLSVSDFVLIINKELNLNKFNLELKRSNIFYDTKDQIIKIAFIQSYSFFNFRQLSDNDINSISDIIVDQTNKFLIKKEFSIIPVILLEQYNKDIGIYYKIISSIIFLTLFFNFVYALVKYRNFFF